MIDSTMLLATRPDFRHLSDTGLPENAEYPRQVHSVDTTSPIP
jgi:hypothetical protein